MNIKQHIYEYLDDHMEENFNDYDSRESILECAIDLVERNDDLTQGCGVGPIQYHIEAWIDQFEKGNRSRKLYSQLQDTDVLCVTSMTNIEQQIYEYLDDRIGFNVGEDFDDYDSRESILETAIDLVERNDDLTQGCGVGPIQYHIEAWIDQFEKETHRRNLDSKLENKVLANNRPKI